MPELYLHGLSQGDFELALRGLLGDGAPLSASSIARLRATWEEQFETWQQRRLDDRELVYAWADGIYVKAGLEKDKAALLVVIGALSDGRKEILAIRPGHRESTESWQAVLRDLRDRGLPAPRLVLADGGLPIWSAVDQVWPEAAQQRCWNHKILNVLNDLPKRVQGAARALLTQIPTAKTRRQAQRRRDRFVARYSEAYPAAAATLERDWDRMVTFYDFPEAHWRHLRTTNPVESPFASVRLRTNAGKRYKRVQGATALIWRVLRVAETRFRKLNAQEIPRRSARPRADFHQGRNQEGRLISFTHLLTGPRSHRDWSRRTLRTIYHPYGVPKTQHQQDQVRVAKAINLFRVSTVLEALQIALSSARNSDSSLQVISGESSLDKSSDS